MKYSQKELFVARKEALEKLLGRAQPEFYHSEKGGADVLLFDHFLSGGWAFVSAEMTLPDAAQVPNESGNYEIMLCARYKAEWAPFLVSQLALFTLKMPIEAGDVMDYPYHQGSPVKALLFAPAPVEGRFHFLGEEYGLLLVIGVTKAEADYAKEHGVDALVGRMKEKNLYPFTDFARDSVV